MHLFFYTIFCRLYLLALQLAALWNPKARLWLAGRKNWEERLARLLADNLGTDHQPIAATAGSPRPASGTQLVWMHCASLGEFEQGRPVLEQLRQQYPGIKILLTFFSPSGYEIRKNYPGADIVFYLPMDSARNARLFLDMVQPSLVVWVKYEYWYHYLVALKKRNIPTLLVSGIFRTNQAFFKWYGRLHRYMLESFHHLFVQTTASQQLLARLGFTKQVTVSGDTRFDRVTEIAEQFEALPQIAAFCGQHPVIVAGSTWPEDEEELDHYANTQPGIRFIIAPHEIEEDHLQEVEKLFKYSVRFSAYEQQVMRNNAQATTNHPPQTPNTLIIDNIGMLSRLYKYATITYVGGGFGEDGVHNLLEAAVYGKPIVMGPVYDKYAEAVDLVEAAAAFPVENALELEKMLDQLLADKTLYEQSCSAALNYVYANKGATQKVMAYIQENRLLTI